VKHRIRFRFANPRMQPFEILEAAPELAVILPAQDVGHRQE